MKATAETRAHLFPPLHALAARQAPERREEERPSGASSLLPKGGRIILAGGEHPLALPLAEDLERRGFEPVALVRHPERWRGRGVAVRWNARRAEESWTVVCEGARAVVNLSGAPLPKPERGLFAGLRHRSRMAATEALGDGLRLVYRLAPVWVEISDLGIYGDAGDRICDEAAFVPEAPAAERVVAREEAFGRAVRPEMRWVVLRTGRVLGVTGRKSSEWEEPSGAAGRDDRWISWIHIDDFTRMVREAIENDRISGICHATGLQPVTAAEFRASVRRVTGSGGAPLGWASRLFAGWTRPAVPGSCRALPVRIHRTGFRFRHHELDEALADLAGGASESRSSFAPLAVGAAPAAEAA